MSTTRKSIYKGDSLNLTMPDYDKPSGQAVPYGTDVKNVYFDGYPQIEKEKMSQPIYDVKIEKNVKVPMRDGQEIVVDIYRPDIEEDKEFPVLLSWGLWGKDAQQAVAWNADKLQSYYNSPFWDGVMEAGHSEYLVARGYIHVIADPKGIGNSDGTMPDFESVHNPDDIHDTIEWIADQSWSNGKVGMLGPSSYSVSQASIAENDPPESLIAIHPDEQIYFNGPHFHGMFDTLPYHIESGRHGNDSTFPRPNRPYEVKSPKMFDLPKEELNQRLQEALDHPDIKYNSKWYSFLKYPYKDPSTFDRLLNSFHPESVESKAHRINIPIYLGTSWGNRLYIWGAFHVLDKASTPQEQKKMIMYPPGFPPRPNVLYHDEIVRWYDYWLKGIDNGIMDEPPIKMFVMGINKWRFENEWPLRRTEYTKFYLHPEGKLSTEEVEGSPEPDTLTQPAPYEDPTVYCLRYLTPPMEQDSEVTGPVAIHFEASIDTDDTNWMIDLVDVDPDGNRQLLSQGYLKAQFRALDEENSKPWQPIHPRQEPEPVTPGEVTEYSIEMMPTANVFKKGHSIEVIIRNQDDVLSRLGTWGYYMLPFMKTVTHKIHFGNSHILLPIIPKEK
ncbi:CocE/NonD family hydrolase [Oceanobacillus piezotolerans]|uniref:CocE/NonD family hydrolase n=1 Tax=Oceanobacillus piezotolerans TaxID=2448030 RepID=A0A498DLM4_9BACI|nr:CocE/NonD family hydrolase [Oceanobacillus piezotolerans]RLL43879.1 CocE/NonD family hydrolase [Oceanobacillus piezotolerans]